MNAIRYLLLSTTILLSPAASAAQAVPDANLHQLVGTLTACSCKFFTDSSRPAPCGLFTACGIWICFASFDVAAPYPHYDESNPALVTTELVEQAIGQCSETFNWIMPRKVRAYFWLEAGGIDWIHEGVIRRGAKVYYLQDLGPVE